MTHSVTLLAFNGMKMLDLTGPAEVLNEANRRGANYTLRFVSPDGEPALTSVGASITVASAAKDVAGSDTVIIAGGDDLPEQPLPQALADACLHLVNTADRVVSICTGAFLLARLGVLDGRHATTHWAHASLLARAYPAITVEPDALFVSDGHLYTSAGVTAGIDLALALVEADHGPTLARRVAQELVMFMQRPGGQSQFSSMLSISTSSHDGVQRVVDSIKSDPAAPHDLPSLARIAGVSQRHLVRLFQADLGVTPAKLVEQVRLETAKSLLLRGEPVASTAIRSGFLAPETMRRIFMARLGMPPSTFQQRFSSAGRGLAPASKSDTAPRP